MTTSGGTSNFGVLFEYDPATGVYTKKLDFDGAANGRYPYGSLAPGGSGKLYGMTYSGGTSYFGVLFEYDPATGVYTKKHDFEGAANGRYPRGSLALGGNGKLYGMTNQGGTFYSGVLFEYDPATGGYTKKLDFDGAANGSYPFSSLAASGNGKLYGMTISGGTSNSGVLFEYYPATGVYTKKI